MSRVVKSSELIFDQISVYDNVGDRIEDLTDSDFTLVSFRNNQPQSWTMADGSSVSNGSISSGVVYFNQVSANPGYYSVRLFLPNTGFWTFYLKHAASGVEYMLSYDADPGPDVCLPTITASFT